MSGLPFVAVIASLQCSLSVCMYVCTYVCMYVCVCMSVSVFEGFPSSNLCHPLRFLISGMLLGGRIGVGKTS